MRRFLVKLQYNGKNYDGWQALPLRRTVQGVVEEAIVAVFSQPCKACGCSRTDAGVSAEEYFFHFDVDTLLPADRVAFKLNRFLPKDVQAQASEEIPFDFDARHSCTAKTYEYAVYSSPHVMPLVNPHAVHVKSKLNLTLMQAVAQTIVGKHNFAAFTTPNAECSGTTRNVLSCEIVADGCEVRMRITADGFLHKMMRNLCGMLVAVGQGALTEGDVQDCLATGKRAEWVTLPPKGLVLRKVHYPSKHKH